MKRQIRIPLIGILAALVLCGAARADWTMGVSAAQAPIIVPTGQGGYTSLVLRDADPVTWATSFTVWTGMTCTGAGTVVAQGGRYTFSGGPYAAAAQVGCVQANVSGNYTFAVIGQPAVVAGLPSGACGSPGQLTYNNAGVCGGVAGSGWDGTTLTLPNLMSSGDIIPKPDFVHTTLNPDGYHNGYLSAKSVGIGSDGLMGFIWAPPSDHSLWYSHCNDNCTSTHTQQITTAAFGNASMSMTPSGLPALAYTMSNGSGFYDVHYVITSDLNGTISSDTIVYPAGSTSGRAIALQVDSSGNPWILWGTGSTLVLSPCTITSGIITCPASPTVIDASGDYYAPTDSLITPSMGGAAVTYGNATDRLEHLAEVSTLGVVTCDAVISGPTDPYAADIASQPGGNPTVAVLDGYGSTFITIYQDSACGSYAQEDIPTSGYYTLGLAVDPAGNPHVAVPGGLIVCTDPVGCSTYKEFPLPGSAAYGGGRTALGADGFDRILQESGTDDDTEYYRFETYDPPPNIGELNNPFLGVYSELGQFGSITVSAGPLSSIPFSALTPDTLRSGSYPLASGADLEYGAGTIDANELGGQSSTVNASGSACAITAIANGLITAATCTP